MSLEETLPDEGPGATETPACKKPRLAEQAKNSLNLTPPAVVGPQTVSSQYTSSECWLGFENVGANPKVNIYCVYQRWILYVIFQSYICFSVIPMNLP